MIRCAVTGGAGQIAYSLLFRLASGEVFGADTPVALHILEVPQALGALEGVRMELNDCAFPLLKEIHVGSDPRQVFADVDYALLVGAFPRGPGMERKDLLEKNAQIFIEQGAALNDVASRNVKVLVVGNPCNTNAWIAMSQAPSIPRENFYAMTRLDENRARAQIALKAGCSVQEVKNLVIFGNHSATQVPDFTNATVQGKPLLDVVSDRQWLEGAFFEKVQKRGAEIIQARGKSSAASAAHAAVNSLQSLVSGKALQDDSFSLACVTDTNPYGIESDLIFSFPCRCNEQGKVTVTEGWSFDAFIEEKIRQTEKELIEERDAVGAMLRR